MQRRHFLQSVPLATLGLGAGTSISSQEVPVSLGAHRQAGQLPWRPDGWGWRGMIGLLIPHTDIQADGEFAVLGADGVSTHAMRVRFGGVVGSGASVNRARSFADPPAIDEGAALLADIRSGGLGAIAYCFTSSSYVLGPDGDAALKARLEARTKGIPVTLTCLAAVEAMRVFGARRIAVVSPPWFKEDVPQRGKEYFQHQGFEVIYNARVPGPETGHHVHASALFEWARMSVPKEADTVFFGGNGMHAIGVIQALEEAIGIPVLTSNQVAFWHALHLAKIRAKVVGYGRLFEKQPLSSRQ